MPLLTDAGQGVEAQIKPQLTGFFGAVIRSYLPQRWVFQTEEGAATLNVDAHGAVTVLAGAQPQPDVTVRIGHAKLAAALTHRRAGGLPPGPVDVKAHTPKGQTAFDFARRRLGL
ncbi:MAG: hypothetical protein L3K17_01060 [Thermoplasmata archaeon]|nr:hypothetical protein [Thermoplasmata archaeon]